MWFEFWIESVPLIPAIKLGAAFVLSRASSQIAQILQDKSIEKVVFDKFYALLSFYLQYCEIDW